MFPAIRMCVRACVRACVCGHPVFPVHCISCDAMSLSHSISIFISFHLLPNRHPTRLINTLLRPSSNPRHLLRVLLVHTSPPLQQALLDRTARLPVRNRRSQRSAWSTARGRRNAASAVRAIGRGARVGDLLREVRDGVWGRVGVAEASDERVVGFAGFGQGVVARVEVFALFQLALD
jgi:hypothetical protein